MQFSKSLVYISLVLILARFVGVIFYAVFSARLVNFVSRTVKFKTEHASRLSKYGGWMTVSNLISPIMSYMDRFFIGSAISMSAVAFYATPYEVVTKIGILPTALVAVLFPAFATSYTQDKHVTFSLYDKAVQVLMMVLFPITLIITAYSDLFLKIWLGADFSVNSAFVLSCLAIGAFLNGLARVPFTFIQSLGMPDVTAKLHFIELPFYIVMLVIFVKYWGINGAAIAWSSRTLLDTLLLFYLSHKHSGVGYGHKNINLTVMTSCLLTLTTLLFVHGYLIKTLVCTFAIIIFFFVSTKYLGLRFKKLMFNPVA